MKMYKGIILTIMLGWGILTNIASISAYEGITIPVLLTLMSGGIWFNWQYATGNFPLFNFLKATCVGWVLGTASLLVVINFFVDKYSRTWSDVAVLFWSQTPNIFITPASIAPLSVLFWRWIFKEVREANKPTIGL